MKDAKYFVLLIVSIVIFVYTVAFMPSVKLLSDYSQDDWVSNPEDLTNFYTEGIQNIDVLNDKYSGSISLKELCLTLELSIGRMQELGEKYDNTQATYEANKYDFFEIYGVKKYDEYKLLCDSLIKVYSINAKDIVSYVIVDGDTINNLDGNDLSFQIIVEYVTGLRNTYNVTFYNNYNNITNDQGNIVTANIKILPKEE